MERRKFSRELKLEAVKLVVERDVGFAQAARDLDLLVNVLRKGSGSRLPIRCRRFRARAR